MVCGGSGGVWRLLQLLVLEDVGCRWGGVLVVSSGG